jgi:hypothetical protein
MRAKRKGVMFGYPWLAQVIWEFPYTMARSTISYDLNVLYDLSFLQNHMKVTT